MRKEIAQPALSRACGILILSDDRPTPRGSRGKCRHAKLALRLATYLIGAEGTLDRAQFLVVWVQEHQSIAAVHVCVRHRLVDISLRHATLCVVDGCIQSFPFAVDDEYWRFHVG